ncbi:MAG: TPM domain-containing protein [Verrucomicrobiales bacterium]|nr:TPM domain-containing protein [Verrucomicrobiales bacterium]
MKCPSCQRPVDHEAESCYSCGYSEIEASVRYGANRVMLNRVHDAAACLRKQERDELAAAIDQLEINFPQILFSAYLGSLPDDLSISELGFWLLNHGQVKGAEYVRPNENAILLILDMSTRQVGISLGYFTESLITEEEAYRALLHARPHLLNAEYGEALEKIFLRLARVLRRKGRKLRKISHQELQAQSRALNENSLDLMPHLAPRVETKTEEPEKVSRSA